MGDMSTYPTTTTEPAAATTASGATGRDNVAPVPPPMRRHPETGFECACPNGPCPTMDRHVDECMYRRDMLYGDPWARRPAADVTEQRHVELLAGTLAAALISSLSAEPTVNSCSDACSFGLELAQEIIRQNRKGKR